MPTSFIMMNKQSTFIEGSFNGPVRGMYRHPVRNKGHLRKSRGLYVQSGQTQLVHHQKGLRLLGVLPFPQKKQVYLKGLRLQSKQAVQCLPNTLFQDNLIFEPLNATSNNFDSLILLLILSKMFQEVTSRNEFVKPRIQIKHACYERNEERRKGTNLQVMMRDLF